MSIRIEVTIRREDLSPLDDEEVTISMVGNFTREELAHAVEQTGRAAFTAFTQSRPEPLPF